MASANWRCCWRLALRCARSNASPWSSASLVSSSSLLLLLFSSLLLLLLSPCWLWGEQGERGGAPPGESSEQSGDSERAEPERERERADLGELGAELAEGERERERERECSLAEGEEPREFAGELGAGLWLVGAESVAARASIVNGNGLLADEPLELASAAFARLC